jgi:hypothetical protein
MFSLLKFFGGFNIFNGEKLAKLLFWAILIAAGIGVYHNAFKPKTVTINQAPVTYHTETIVKDQPNIASLQLWRIRLGVSYAK